MAPLPQSQTAVQINRTGGAEVIEVNHSAPIPTPEPDQILVKNTFSGVNYIDTYFRSGLYPPGPFPYTLGREGEGTIVAVGSQTTGFSVGDYVGYTGTSTQAEYTAVPTTHVVKVPTALQGKGLVAASLIQGLTALTMIRESYEVKKGDVVLVHAAAGGVGLWLCQLLRAVGAGGIIATASTEEKLELAKQNGATHGINYSSEDWVAKAKEISRSLGKEGVIAVFDGVGKSTFEGDLEVLARKGTLVSFGNASGQVPPFMIARLATKNLKVLRPTLFNYVHTRQEFDQYAGELLELIEGGKVEVKVHKEYSLDEAQQVHKDIEGRGTVGKLLYKL